MFTLARHTRLTLGPTGTKGDDLPVTAPTFETVAGPCPAFEVFEPARPTTPFVFCSPHSGRAYPLALLERTRLRGAAIRRSEDLFVDQLFDFVPSLGAPLIVARFPRAFVDVNREPYELDPRMFADKLPAHVNSSSARVAGGLGTIPRIVAERQEIYAGKLERDEAFQRIDTLYHPFHEAVAELVERTRRAFGLAILVDCHSMPSNVRAMPGNWRPDVVIGDRFGTSASPRIAAMAVERLMALGFDVARNKPYAGGFITERYGRPRAGVHALQVELNRSIYADEDNLVPHAGFEPLRERLRAFVGFFSAEIDADLERPLAAE